MGKVRPLRARRSPRLAGYDDGQAGLYFVTVCTWGREPLLGEIVSGEMRCGPAGLAVQHARESLPLRFPSLALDAFVVMPNRVHGILALGADPSPPLGTPTTTLAAVLRAFKSVSAVEANRALGRPGQPFWQRSDHDHIVRHDRALAHVRRYIADNPARWDTDPDNPQTDHPPNAHNP
ncbi:MAG: transposase [Chloroflexota bacterium]|nr:transposase [Chloroflexota bacterium]